MSISKKGALIPAAGIALIQALSGQPALADADWDRYADSGYAYCDATILASMWGMSVEEAKSTIGSKLGWDDFEAGKAAVRDALKQARKQGKRCSFHDTTFSYDDAAALAKYWGTSVAEAKASLAEKVSLGNLRLAVDAVAAARSGK
jgi:hypothetical protein